MPQKSAAPHCVWACASPGCDGWLPLGCRERAFSVLGQHGAASMGGPVAFQLRRLSMTDEPATGPSLGTGRDLAALWNAGARGSLLSVRRRRGGLALRSSGWAESCPFEPPALSVWRLRTLAVVLALVLTVLQLPMGLVERRAARGRPFALRFRASG